MSTYVIFRDRGKQYGAHEGETVEVELLAGGDAGARIRFDEVCLVKRGEECRVGVPLVNRLVVFNGKTSQFREVLVQRDRECAICGEQPSIRAANFERGRFPEGNVPGLCITRREHGEEAGDVNLPAASD